MAIIIVRVRDFELLPVSLLNKPHQEMWLSLCRLVRADLQIVLEARSDIAIDPNNKAIQSLKADIESTGETTGKYTIADERKHNVFLRLTSEAVLEKTKASNPVEAMSKLREMKNNFKG